MKLINERQWNGGWMEPNPRSQMLRGKPREKKSNSIILGWAWKAKEWLELLFSCGGFVLFGWLVFFYCGLWAAGQPMLRNERDQQPNQPNQLLSLFLFLLNLIQSTPFILIPQIKINWELMNELAGPNPTSINQRNSNNSTCLICWWLIGLFDLFWIESIL